MSFIHYMSIKYYHEFVRFTKFVSLKMATVKNNRPVLVLKSNNLTIFAYN